MGSEAHRLIGISLSKIAQSRNHRGGVSLHKNLLVATVLQKARYIFMEEAYQMVHCHSSIQQPIQPRPITTNDQDNLIGLTVEEAGLESSSLSNGFQESSSSSSDSNQDETDFLQSTTASSASSTTQSSSSSCIKCVEHQQDKENHPPYSNELTYLDLDKTSNVLRERSNSTSSSTNSTTTTTISTSSLKRRRNMTEWETEEAVQSILPKKFRQDDEISDDGISSSDDSGFLDDATLLSDIVSKEIVEVERCQDTSTTSTTTTPGNGSAMEIDRITSLVSIFSFSMNGNDSGGGGGGGGVTGPTSNNNKLSRSMSTPDLCSAQAKDSSESIQQRPFLAMTV